MHTTTALNLDAREFVPLRCDSKHFVANNNGHIPAMLNPTANIFEPLEKTLHLDEDSKTITLNRPPPPHTHTHKHVPVYTNDHLDNTHLYQTCRTLSHVPILRNDDVDKTLICEP